MPFRLILDRDEKAMDIHNSPGVMQHSCALGMGFEINEQTASWQPAFPVRLCIST